MVSAPVFWDPLDTAPLIDRMIGDEYEVIKRVAENIPGFLASFALIGLSAEEILAFTDRLVELETLAGSLAGVDMTALTELIESETLARTQGDQALSALIAALDTISDQTVVTLALKANQTLDNVSNSVFAAKIAASGYVGGGGSNELKSLDDYGTLDPTGVADVSAVFAAAVADTTADRIYIPEGTHYTSAPISSLRKGFWGPGKIRLSTGTILPADFTYIATNPTQYTQAYTTPWPPNVTPWFGGDNKHTRPQCVIVAPKVRRGLDERYFEGSVIPRNGWMESYGGWSGASAHLSGVANAGWTNAALNSAIGFEIGDVIGFSTLGGVGGGTAANIVDRVTITGVSDNVISFTPQLSTSYSLGATVTHGTRTQTVFDHIMVEVLGGGDQYGSTIRMRHKYTLLPGQTHVFEGSTASQYGGSIIYYGDGQYGTGFETQFKTNGGAWDVGNIGMVQSFIRDNDTGARSAVWLGTLFKSEGIKPADACHVVVGKWRVGLDLAKADFSLNSEAAIQLKTGHRIYLNASDNSTSGRGSDPTGNYPVLYGNVLGDSYISHSVDGTGPMVDIFCGSTYRLRIRSNGTLGFNGNFNISGALQAGTDVTVGATGLLSWFGSNIRIFKSGASLRYSEDGGSTSVPLVSAAPVSSILSQGAIFGLTLSNNSGNPNTHLNLATGQARDSTDLYDLRLAAGLVKRLDQVWALGTNAGARDTSA